MGCVYVVTNKMNGKKYVGKTIGMLIYRKNNHIYFSENGSTAYFHRALRKYGFDAFEWKVVVEDDDENELNEIEMILIKRWRTKAPNGYNMTDGGEGNEGRVQSHEEIEKRANANRGKKRRQLTKDRIAEKLKGEGNGRAVLTERLVLKMRSLRRKGMKVKDIAELFDVPYSTATCVINGDAWPHLPRALKTWRAKKTGV